MKVRKRQFGKLLQEAPFGLGRGTEAGRDGGVGNFPECMNLGAAN